MDNEAILNALKFTAPVFGLIAGIWSTTQKITFEDAEGAKRLTLQGRVLIGFAVVSTLISVLALGLETIIEQSEEAAAVELARKDLDRQNVEKARAVAAAAARDQKAALDRLEDEAKLQTGFRQQQSLIAATALREQRRDAALSLQVARDANQRLAEAAQTLAELDRVNNPLRTIDAEVILQLDFSGTDLAEFWTELATREDILWMRNYRLNPRNDVAVFTVGKDRILSDVEYRARGPRIRVDFLKPTRECIAAKAPRIDRLVALDTMPGSGCGILPIRLNLDRIEAETGTKLIKAVFSVAYKTATEGTIDSGEKVSLSDIRSLTPVLNIDQLLNTPGRQRLDRVERVYLRLNGQFYVEHLANGVTIDREITFVLPIYAPRR